jgi:hypothetical protein
MFVCGREEPLMPNPQLHALDEVSGRIGLCDVSDERLNRYSFVWYGAFEDFSLNVERLLSHQECLFHSPVHFITAFPTSTDEAFRSKLQMRMREKAGWSILVDHNIAVAVKEESSSLKFLSPQDQVAILEGAMFILGGVKNALEKQMLTPIERSLQLLGHHGKLVPGPSMLAWLWEYRGQLGYFARSDRDRQGLILITPYKVALNELMEVGLVQQVYDFPEAADVWVLQ